MDSLWSDVDADRMIADYAAQGVNEELALRVYTTQLLGGNPELVLHGGGNTSVKSTADGDVPVLCVKGSGWDMASIEPPGLPAVTLEPLLALEDREALGDEDMVRVLRQNLIDPGAPNPSIETLLHAFLPHKFVDHTHANAVVTLSDQPDGDEICAELYDGRAPVVPWVMPGFDLAKVCAATWRDNRDAEGLILSKHGIFSFGETAREAYERMIDLVGMAERRLENSTATFVQAALPEALASAAEIAPILRGALADRSRPGAITRFVLDHRSSPEIRHYVDGADLADYGLRGPVTPDHILRTKQLPLVLPAPEAEALDTYDETVREAVARYVEAYRAYFERNNNRVGNTKTMLDPMPRVVLVPGVGLFAADKSAKDAAVTADLAETMVGVTTAAQGLGEFTPLPEAELFDIEYWSLEQAKLKKVSEKPLQRRIVAVTGGAGAIGRAAASAFQAEGAEVALIDLPGDGLDAAADELGLTAAAGDVTDPVSLNTAFAEIAGAFGGLDILVSNAGAAWQGLIGEVDEDIMRRSFELNFWGHQRAAQAAVRIMKAQGTGGALIFNISKQAINPGPKLGPYGIPKAAAMALMRQYALEYGTDGITSNAVNADRIRSGLLSDDMVKARSEARGVSEADYMSGNLLGREVTAADVAEAFVNLAKANATTGAVLTVDGGNVAAMMR